MPTAPPIILIVDDVAANRETLVELLTADGCCLIEASDGIQALELAAANPPDLILLDVMMPQMDGFEVCRRLRANPGLTEVPVIIVTALDDRLSRIKGIESGADDFISKPFDRAELRARVRTVTRLNRYRRLAEARESLSESEERFQKLAEHSDEGFWFITVQPEQITYVSPAVEKIYGLPAAKFYEDPRGWIKSLHPDDQPRVDAAYEAVLAGRAARFNEEYRVVRPDGTIRWVLDSGTPTRNGDDAITGMGGVARDITERKNAEEHLLRAQRVEKIGMLAAGIAHDFNNALAPIIMAGPLLQKYVSDPGGHRLLGLVEKSAMRGAALVRQLLSFARGASGKTQLLQVRPILCEVTELAEVTFPKSIRVEAHLPGELWPVQADPTQIHQVLLNLCVNARDAMPRGGTLTVTAANTSLDATAAAAIPGARPGDFLAIEVRDTGTGIPPEVLARIWEPFFTTKGVGKGTGLGLSTVQGILHQHNGFVALETRAGHGTAFTIYLPAEFGAAGNNAAPDSACAARGHGELILIVDDEEPVRQICTEILSAHGYRAMPACDGAEAIALFASQAADVALVITDSDMPVLDGTALAAVLWRLKPDLSIIGMSGGGTRPQFSPVFIAKPFEAAALLGIVRNTLDANPATRAARPAA